VGKPLLGPPEILRIPAEGPPINVGRLDDDTQYLKFGFNEMTPHDTTKLPKEYLRQEIGVLHLFDSEGTHLCSEARLGHFNFDWDEDDWAWAELREMFGALWSKNRQKCDIFVKPFSVILNGVTHGLIYQAIQPEPDVNCPVFESVMLDPAHVMFHPPWDSGQWST
jgi:hypothetical protein